MSQPITAADVKLALKKHFAHPEYGIVFEVARGTGAGAHRHIDAMAMSLWPSRGLDIHAIEVKVSRADWRREKAQPQKAEEIAQFCDFFWVAAPEGVVPVLELPTAWGLLELGAKGFKIAKAAVKTDAKDGGRALLAAVMRAASRPAEAEEVATAIEAARKALEEMFDKRVEAAIERRRLASEERAAKWDRLCAAVDCSPGWCQEDNLAAAVRIVNKLGIGDTYSGLANLRGVLARAHADVDKALSALGLAAPAPKGELQLTATVDP